MLRRTHHTEITPMGLCTKTLFILRTLLVYIRVEYLINFRKLEHYYGLIENDQNLGEEKTSEYRIAWIRRVRKAVNYISPLIPKKHYCLSRVLIGRILLNQKSIATSIEFNMNYSDKEKLLAHCKLVDCHSKLYIFS